MILIECFVVLCVGVDGLKFFSGDMIGFVGFKVICVVLLKGIEVYVVGGVNFSNFKDWVVVGVIGFGIGFVIFKSGDMFFEVCMKVDVIVVVYDEVLV